MQIELLILDIDGVLTDGKKYYGIDGLPFAKTYCDKDFTAIKRVRGAGVPVCFLSGDERINKKMAENRNIDFYSARGKDKAGFLPELSEKYGVPIEKMLYVGDDLFDLSIMKAVGHAFCPKDAALMIRDFCGPDNILTRSAGENVIAELVDVLISKNMIQDCTMEDIENLDKNEKF